MAEPRPARLVLSEAQRRELVDHAATTDREVCGVIVGRGERATRVIRCRNVAEDARAAGPLQRAEATGYVIDPLQLRDIFLEIDETGERVLAYYHSHPPHAEPRPSRTDVRDAKGSLQNTASLYVVVHGGAPHPFAIDDDARPVPLVIEP